MITFFAHSTSVDNERRVCSGWNDPQLSVIGKVQAERLREQLECRNFDLVYTSDLTRAKETARIAFPHARVITDLRLREMNYGDYNGLAVEKFPSDRTSCVNERYPNGENCLDVEHRIRLFLQEIGEPRVNITIVSHKYPQLALEVICNGVCWEKAINNDWRETEKWQPGWKYEFDSSA